MSTAKTTFTGFSSKDASFLPATAPKNKQISSDTTAREIQKQSFNAKHTVPSSCLPDGRTLDQTIEHLNLSLSKSDNNVWFDATYLPGILNLLGNCALARLQQHDQSLLFQAGVALNNLGNDDASTGLAIQWQKDPFGSQDADIPGYEKPKKTDKQMFLKSGSTYTPTPTLMALHNLQHSMYNS